MEQNEKILSEILKAIFWNEFSEDQKKEIIRILDAEQIHIVLHSIAANKICELLDIPKRGNRRAINKIISENILPF